VLVPVENFRAKFLTTFGKGLAENITKYSNVLICDLVATAPKTKTNSNTPNKVKNTVTVTIIGNKEDVASALLKFNSTHGNIVKKIKDWKFEDVLWQDFIEQKLKSLIKMKYYKLAISVYSNKQKQLTVYLHLVGTSENVEKCIQDANQIMNSLVSEMFTLEIASKFSVVVEKIERQYDVKLIVDNKTGHYRIFGAKESVKNVKNYLASLLGNL
jgi:hypothetical protein